MKATVNENGVLISALGNKYIDILSKEVLTEGEINSIKNFINNKASKEERDIILNLIADNSKELTKEHNIKGFNFVKGLLYTPGGKERVSHVFGYREIEVINTFEQFLLIGFYNTARYGQRDFYVPIYRMIGNELVFDYYYNYEGLSIIG